MKKGFTIVEVSILFVIFLIVAFLVAPLSLDDTKLAKNLSRWRSVQPDFSNIFYSINTNRAQHNIEFKKALEDGLANDIKSDSESYKIEFMNGTYPSDTYRFKDFKTTYSNAVFSVKLFDKPENNIYGLFMYDVNGKNKPNVWGKDVFGMYIYEDKFEPLCKTEPLSIQKQDCSKDGSGVCCSNYYLIGGSFD